jgi:hypothetical protein
VASLKIALPITPANASAPAITINRVCNEPVALAGMASAVASGTGALAFAGVL